MKRLEIRATWESVHSIEVPDDTEVPPSPTLDQVMDLVRLDPESGGDITPQVSSIIDWEVDER
jgi:hypothetical protein